MKKPKYSLIILIAILLLSIILFISIANEVVIEKEDKIDNFILDFFGRHSSDLVNKIFHVFTFFGSIAFLLSAFIIVFAWLLIVKRKTDAVTVAIAGVFSVSILELFKNLFKRHRPDLPVYKLLTNYSFPSGHSFLSFVFYSILALLVWKSNWTKKTKIIILVALFLFVMAIGFSRIILRYHYASDVVGGVLLGAACLCGYLIYANQRKRRTGTDILKT